VADSLELSRFVLLDAVPSNGETWFLGRCFDLLRREGFIGVLAFSDPVPRSDASGRTLFVGHIGTIYQAHNAVYLGRGTARSLHVLPDGTIFSDRAAQKVRKGERGWRYAIEQLVTHGAEPPRGETRDWLRHWLPKLTRTVRHGGNLKYAWVLDARNRRYLPGSLPYPKWDGFGGVRMAA